MRLIFYVPEFQGRGFILRNHVETGSISNDDLGLSKRQLSRQIKPAWISELGNLLEVDSRPVAECLQPELTGYGAKEVPLVISARVALRLWPRLQNRVFERRAHGMLALNGPLGRDDADLMHLPGVPRNVHRPHASEVWAQGADDIPNVGLLSIDFCPVVLTDPTGGHHFCRSNTGLSGEARL